MPGSPNCNIAKKVTEWLSVIPESNNQCNSKIISDKLKDIKLSEGEILVSFDVVSLYTNVPVLEAIQEAADEFELPQVIFIPVIFIKLLELLGCQRMMDIFLPERWPSNGFTPSSSSG